MSLKLISRSAGRSSVRAAAYRAAEKIYDHRTGEWRDYTQKRGVVHSEILLPEHAPEHYHDRAILWNSVEHIEKAKNSQVAREVEIALPRELGRTEQIRLTRDFVQAQFVSQGMCADVNIHEKGKNVHAHIMLTTRPINPDGTWGAKSSKEYVFDRRGQRIMLDSGEWKSRKVSAVDWNERDNAEIWREAWGKALNRELERRGLEPVDHRSYKRQGLDKEPQQHMGPQALELEQQGEHTRIGDRNRAIRERNAQREPERQKEQAHDRLPSYEEWLDGHKKEQSRGMERSR
jgi:ATP-dependent exoDNAse (exonuclease V) alpha subunit